MIQRCISQDRLGNAVVTNNPQLSVAYYIKTHFFLMRILLVLQLLALQEAPFLEN